MAYAPSLKLVFPCRVFQRPNELFRKLFLLIPIGSNRNDGCDVMPQDGDLLPVLIHVIVQQEAQ